MKKILLTTITIILTIVIGTGIASAASYSNEELDNLIATEYTYMEHAHNMAEAARALGYSDDSEIIKIAKQHYCNAENNVSLYMSMYNDVSSMGPKELLIYKCNEKGIDPLLPVSISKLETGNWTSSAYRNRNNFGGMMGKNGLMRFSSKEEGAEAFVNLIIKYYNKGMTTPEAMQNTYCPDGTPWAQRVRYIMNQGL